MAFWLIPMAITVFAVLFSSLPRHDRTGWDYYSTDLLLFATAGLSWLVYFAICAFTGGIK